MSRFVLLIGPPGAGKSTISKRAKQRGLNAVDLEDFGHGTSGHGARQRAAEKLIKEQKGDGFVIVAMADIDPAIFPKDSARIMLLPSHDIYLKRLQNRDALLPHKKGQEGKERKYAEFTEWSKKFEYVIHNNSTPEDTLEKILAYISGRR